MITRYDISMFGDDMVTEPSSDGEWVKYEDHAADRAALVARVTKLEHDNETLSRLAKEAGLKWFRETERANAAESEVARLREALGAARVALQTQAERAETAEARVRELERERDEARENETFHRDHAEGYAKLVAQATTLYGPTEEQLREELAELAAPTDLPTGEMPFDADQIARLFVNHEMTKSNVGIGEVVEHITEWSRGRARRAGWNGKGMFLYYCPGLDSEDGFVMMRTARGSYVPWLCSQTDLLADDWELFVGEKDEPRENP